MEQTTRDSFRACLLGARKHWTRSQAHAAMPLRGDSRTCPMQARSMTCVALSDRRLPPRCIMADACETEADRRELQRREAWRLRICRLAAPLPLVMARWTERWHVETTISSRPCCLLSLVETQEFSYFMCFSKQLDLYSCQITLQFL